MPVDHQGASAYSDAMESGRAANLRFSTCWLLSALVLFALMVAWSFATPLGAASDEPTQIVKAAAVARGEFLGQPTGHQLETRVGHEGRAVMTVLVPAAYAQDADLALCYRHHPKRSAACAPAAGTSDRLVATTTYVGRYPPLYYLITGLPSRYLHSGGGIYFMRTLSALASALLLGLALTIAATLSRSRILIGGIALAATPMVIFLGSVINPSGLEVSASIAAWTTGLVLVLERASAPPTRLLVAFAVSGCILESTRGLSPLWLLLIAVTLVALEPRRCWELIRQRAVQIAAACVVVTGIVATAYIVLAQASAITPSGIPLPAHSTILSVADLFGSHSTGYVTQIIGDFGWLDTPAPFLAVFLIGAAIIGLLWLSFATSRRGHAAVLVGVLVAALIVPMAIDIKNALQIHNDVWQSRYTLPLYLGVPLVAAAISGRRKTIQSSHIRIMIVGTASTVAFCQFICFFSALHRYTAGLHGGLDPLARGRGIWAPPIPAVVLLVFAALATGLYGWWIVRLDRSRSPAPSETAESPTSPVPTPRPAATLTGS